MCGVEDFEGIEVFSFTDVDALVGEFGGAFFAFGVDVLSPFGFAMIDLELVFEFELFEVPFAFAQQIHQVVHVVNFLYVGLAFGESKLAQHRTLHFIIFPLFIIIPKLFIPFNQHPSSQPSPLSPLFIPYYFHN